VIDAKMLGLSELLAGLAAAEAEIVAAADEGLADAGAEIKAAWQANIADEGLVLTGRYLDSIAVERDGARVHVVSDVPYSTILEHGDSRQEGHHVAERALDEHADSAIERVGAKVREVVR
jgi:hypothetical protein